MSNYSFFHKSIRLPLVILNLRAFSSKSSYFIFNIKNLMSELSMFHPSRFAYVSVSDQLHWILV
jgi:hypothetical protein